MEVFWVVGEASGDKHAANLISAIQKINPDWRHSGMTGENMKKAGCKSYADISEASVMGLAEVIKHLPRILALRSRLLDTIERINPDIVILVDFPDFNLSLLKQIRKRLGRKIQVVYFVSPQIWAWRSGRAKTMAAQLDAMIVLFPFEVEFYKKYGLETVYQGHPMAGEIKASDSIKNLRKKFNINKDQTSVAILPGSRQHEVERHLEVQLQAVELLREEKPDVIARIAKAGTVNKAMLESFIENRPWAEIIEGSATDLLAASHAGIVKSGTSTVEAAIIGTPYVVMYIVSNMTYRLAKLLIKGVKYIAMVNVLAGREIVRELIQDDASPENLKDELLNIWDGKQRETVISDLAEVTAKLGESGALERIADWLNDKYGE